MTVNRLYQCNACLDQIPNDHPHFFYKDNLCLCLTCCEEMVEPLFKMNFGYENGIIFSLFKKCLSETYVMKLRRNLPKKRGKK